MTAIVLVEWSGFGIMLISAWLYGYPGPGGPSLGVLGALIIFIWALMVGAYGGAIANLAFALIHLRNIFRDR